MALTPNLGDFLQSSSDYPAAFKPAEQGFRRQMRLSSLGSGGGIVPTMEPTSDLIYSPASIGEADGGGADRGQIDVSLGCFGLCRHRRRCSWCIHAAVAFILALMTCVFLEDAGAVQRSTLSERLRRGQKQANSHAQGFNIPSRGHASSPLGTKKALTLPGFEDVDFGSEEFAPTTAEQRTNRAASLSTTCDQSVVKHGRAGSRNALADGAFGTASAATKAAATSSKQSVPAKMPNWAVKLNQDDDADNCEKEESSSAVFEEEERGGRGEKGSIHRNLGKKTMPEVLMTPRQKKKIARLKRREDHATFFAVKMLLA
eukprot:jgi/Bigna1/81220/fgenesh1_pg.78_\